MKVRWLFVAWGIFAALVLLLRFGVVGPREWLTTLYSVGSLALAGGAGTLLNIRFRRDLLAVDRATWEYLTQFPGLGPGYHNNLRELGWIARPSSTIPPHLKPLWLRARKFVWLPVVWFLTTPAICILVSVGGT